MIVNFTGGRFIGFYPVPLAIKNAEPGAIFMIEQIGTPRDLYEQPSSVFVAQFIGSPKMNLVHGKSGTKGLDVGGAAAVAIPSGLDKSAVLSCGIRPEHIAVTTGTGSTAKAHCSGTVALYEYLGSDSFIYVDCGDTGMLTVWVSDQTTYKTGQKIGLAFAKDWVHFFDEDGRALR